MDNSTRKRRKLDNSKHSKDESLLYEIFKIKYPSMEDRQKVLKVLRGNQSLRMKMEEDIGLTIFHIACWVKETSLVEDLLNNGADVNAQISAKSSFWPGYTPLHVCMNSSVPRGLYNQGADVKDIIRLLLNKGADVTLTNKKQRTPIHMAYQQYIANLHWMGVDKSTVERLSMLLRAQKDFTVNPMSIERITHLHIASSLADSASVENFLKCGKVDINQQIDLNFLDPAHFKHFPGAGCTPLHLAVMKKTNFIEFSTQLQTVDLLLKYGADVNAKNTLGDTPFHIALSFEIRERLVRGGANLNAENEKGYTPLEDLLSNRPRSSDEIIERLRCGCLYNAFSSKTEMGFIGLSGRSLSFKEIQKLISTVTANFPDLIKIDNCHRTPIHNLVSVYQIYFSAAEYAMLIEQLARTGCDVDDRDDKGRTALHIAAKFKNLKAINGLLLAGADINITDQINGQMAFAQKCQPYTLCGKPTDPDDEQCGHYRAFKCLALQVRKLQHCGLDVHPANEHIVATAFPNFSRGNLNEQFINELEEMEDVKIASLSLTVRRFLSEIDVVGDYPTMSEIKKKAIDEFFQPGEQYNQFREKYSEIAGLLKLQYRKAVKRTELLQQANVSLQDLLAIFQVPEVCSRVISRFLSNLELESVVAAAEGIKITD